MRRQWAFWVLSFFCLAVAAQAQEISISAQADPQTAAVGESIRLLVTIEGKANISGEPVLPDLPDFQIYGGGRSSNFTFINGQVSSSLQFTYILVPKHSGTFTLGAVTLQHGGKTFSTNPIAITVTGGGGGSSPAPGVPAPGVPAANAPVPSQPQAAPQAAGRHAGEAVFITTQVDRHEVYVNEPVKIIFRFYSRIPILAQPQYTPPDTNGFWSEDLPPQRRYLAQVGGQDYQVIEVRSAIFPTTSGKLTIGPATLVVQVEDFGRQPLDPFSDAFFRNFFSGGRQVALHSEPITIMAKPIPVSGRPASFTGTVGKWSLSAKLDRREAKVGEAVTLEVRIFGDGNVKAVGKPLLPTITGFKIYDTISSSEVQKQGDSVHGVKTYRTLLRPEVTGELALPPITYAYFDPQRGRFEEMSVPGLRLQVSPGEPGAASAAPLPAAPGVPAAGVKMMTNDIRYLKTHLPLTPATKPLPADFWAVGFLAPTAALLLLWLWQRRQDRLASDPRFARRLRAAHSARAALRQARVARQRLDVPGFYAALAQALTGYLADQLGLSRAGVTQREIMVRLAASGVGAEPQQRIADLLQECDFARFAPGQPSAEALEDHERQAEELLLQLVRGLGKEPKR